MHRIFFYFKIKETPYIGASYIIWSKSPVFSWLECQDTTKRNYTNITVILQKKLLGLFWHDSAYHCAPFVLKGITWFIKRFINTCIRNIIFIKIYFNSLMILNTYDLDIYSCINNFILYVFSWIWNFDLLINKLWCFLGLREYCLNIWN